MPVQAIRMRRREFREKIFKSHCECELLAILDFILPELPALHGEEADVNIYVILRKGDG